MNKTELKYQVMPSRKKQYLLQTYKDIKQIKNNTIIKTVLSVHCLRALVSYYTELNDTNKAEQYLKEGDSLHSDFLAGLLKEIYFWVI